MYAHMRGLGTLDHAPDLGQPSQINDRGKNVKASINSPIYRRGQYRQYTMGMETRWTDSHRHWQQTSTAAQVRQHSALQVQVIII